MVIPLVQHRKSQLNKESKTPEIQEDFIRQRSSFVHQQCKPKSGRRQLHHVKNRRLLNVLRRFLYSQMLTTYTPTLNVYKHWCENASMFCSCERDIGDLWRLSPERYVEPRVIGRAPRRASRVSLRHIDAITLMIA